MQTSQKTIVLDIGHIGGYYLIKQMFEYLAINTVLSFSVAILPMWENSANIILIRKSIRHRYQRGTWNYERK